MGGTREVDGRCQRGLPVSWCLVGHLGAREKTLAAHRLRFTIVTAVTHQPYQSLPAQAYDSIQPEPAQRLNRRRFLATTGATVGLTLLGPNVLHGADATAKISIGLIGCGGRGAWIAKLFDQHGGYNLVAVADYFQDRVDAVGEKFKVEPAKRFTGLDAYKRLLEQNLDAVVIESPPYFHPIHAAGAVDAGKHVDLAKPTAVDVPGCQSIAETGRKATAKKRVLLVDFQTRANALHQGAVKFVRDGSIGRIVSAEASYHCGPTWERHDKYLRQDPHGAEARLRAWGLDRLLSGDVITEQNIHALDLATWFLDAEPMKAIGYGGKVRPLMGDCWDHFAVIFHFPDNVLLSFDSKQLGAAYDGILCRVFGASGTAEAHYNGDIWARSTEDVFSGGRVTNLYTEGVVANIASFHKAVTTGDCANATVAPAVRSNLTSILGRTAAYKGAEVTWADMIKASEAWTFDTSGLKA
jgi:myo-inositol 2-dehydrogenase / D-chiro-inositol 1-dehydrogenase